MEWLVRLRRSSRPIRVCVGTGQFVYWLSHLKKAKHAMDQFSLPGKLLGLQNIKIN